MTLAGHFANGSICFKKIPDDITSFKKITDASFSGVKKNCLLSPISNHFPIFPSLGVYI